MTVLPPSLPPHSESDTPRTRESRPRQRQSVEDPLAALGRYHLVFLLDDSPSINPLWDELKAALMGTVKAAIKYVRKGVDIHFMNDEANLIECTKTTEVECIFDTVLPAGSTPTAMRLDDLIRPYVEDCETAKAKRLKLPKPTIFVVITDGRADDPDSVRDLIVEMASRLDDSRLAQHQMGICFLQIGDDPDASAALAELDDDLQEAHNVRDIVDTRQYAGQLDSNFIMKVLLGSVNKMLDNDQ